MTFDVIPIGALPLNHEVAGFRAWPDRGTKLPLDIMIAVALCGTDVAHGASRLCSGVIIGTSLAHLHAHQGVANTSREYQEHPGAILSVTASTCQLSVGYARCRHTWVCRRYGGKFCLSKSKKTANARNRAKISNNTTKGSFRYLCL